MSQLVELELKSHPTTVIIKNISVKFGAVYEIVETRQCFAPNKVTTSRTSRFLCANADEQGQV